jgi:hypothetical protein
MEEIENIFESFNVCSSICKYAYLSASSAKNFAHIPTCINRYIQRGENSGRGCNDDYEEVAEMAEYYWKEKHPEDECNKDERAFHNQLSWNEMSEAYAMEARQAMEEFIITFIPWDGPRENDEYAEALRQSFDQNQHEIAERMEILMNQPSRINLQKHDPERFGNSKINLCHECLMPYNVQDLHREGIRLLCKKTEDNPKPCYKKEEENNFEEASTSRSAWDD